MGDEITADEKWALVEDFADTVEDEYGEGHFVSGDTLTRTPRVPTGSILLDASTGGGWPRGMIDMIWGHEGTGKSTLALHGVKWIHRTCSRCYTLIIPEILLPPGTYERVSHYRWEPLEGEPDDDEVANWREMRLECTECGAPYHAEDRPISSAGDYYDDVPDGVDRGADVCRDCGAVGAIAGLEPDDEWKHPYGDKSCECGENVPTFALWTDAEKTLDRDWARSIGVDMERLRVDVPEYGEASIDRATEAIREGVLDAWIYDSFNNFQRFKEMDDSFQEGSMGTGAARMLNKLFRQLPSFMFNSEVTRGASPLVLGINQVRINVSTGFGGSGHTSYGGKGQDFAASTRIKMTSKKNEVEQHSVKAQDRNEYMGLETEALFKGRCDKNKTAPTDGREFSVRIATTDDGKRYPGKIEDFRLVWRYGRKTEVIQKEDDEWHIDGWPITYDTQGEFLVACHEHWWLKQHVHRESVNRVLDEWSEIQKREF